MTPTPEPSEVTKPPSFTLLCEWQDRDARDLMARTDIDAVSFAKEALRINLWARQYKNEVIMLEALNRLDAATERLAAVRAECECWIGAGEGVSGILAARILSIIDAG